jgi:hypothetical protein
LTSNNQVCVYVQQKILNAEYKEDKIFVIKVETLWKEKTLRGSQTQDIHYTENKASYKTLVLTYPYAVVIALTLTRSPSWTLPNQVSYLKGSSIDSFTLGLIPKIDFTRTVEHTPAMTWELADLRFSLNTLSKHYGIRYKIHTIYKPRALYL